MIPGTRYANLTTRLRISVTSPGGLRGIRGAGPRPAGNRPVEQGDPIPSATDSPRLLLRPVAIRENVTLETPIDRLTD
jgi:hypothetical protein